MFYLTRIIILKADFLNSLKIRFPLIIGMLEYLNIDSYIQRRYDAVNCEKCFHQEQNIFQAINLMVKLLAGYSQSVSLLRPESPPSPILALPCSL